LSAVFAVLLCIAVEYYLVTQSIVNKRLSNAFEVHLLLVGLRNVARRLKVPYMVPSSVVVVIIYVGSLVCTFQILAKDIDDAKLPSDIFGFLVITVTICLVTIQSNYSREAYLRKGFVLEQKLK
jgi:hypothetical protein